MGRPLSDAELEQVTEFIVRRYLEVERGLRDKRCLQRFLTADAYVQQHTQAASRFVSGGIVCQGDIGQMIFQRDGDRVHAAVPTRQAGDRWGALLLELRSNGRDVWRVTELTRAADRNLTRPHPLTDQIPPREPERDAVQSAQTVAAAQLALSAARQRHAQALADLARLAPEKPPADLQPGEVIRPDPSASWVAIRHVEATADGDARITTSGGAALRLPGDRPIPVLATADGDLDAARKAADQAAGTLATTAVAVAHWTRQVADLEQERDELIRRRDLDATLPAPTPAGYLTRTLGPRPSDADARTMWEDAAARIHGYRDRWDITDPRTALGARPHDPTQQSDRDATIAALRQLTSRLDHLQPDSTRRPDARENQTRDPFTPAPPGAQR